MTPDLFTDTHDNRAANFLTREISPQRELGAYEALWMKDGTWFDSLADIFRAHPNSLPSDFVPPADIEKHSRLALDATRAAGIQHFGLRIHGTGEYPERLRDAKHPIELLYYQGHWDLIHTRCIAIVGTREPTDEGRTRAAQLAKHCVDDGFTVVGGLAGGREIAFASPPRTPWCRRGTSRTIYR
jgi:DNA processing protein